MAYAPSVLTLVSLIPLKCPRSASLTPETSLATRPSPRDGESARELWTGEIPGRRPDVLEMWDTVLVRDVCDVTEGDDARPLLCPFMPLFKGVNPVSWSSTGLEVSVDISIENQMAEVNGIPIISWTCVPPTSGM